MTENQVGVLKETLTKLLRVKGDRCTQSVTEVAFTCLDPAVPVQLSVFMSDTEKERFSLSLGRDERGGVDFYEKKEVLGTCLSLNSEFSDYFFGADVASLSLRLTAHVSDVVGNVKDQLLLLVDELMRIYLFYEQRFFLVSIPKQPQEMLPKATSAAIQIWSAVQSLHLKDFTFISDALKVKLKAKMPFFDSFKPYLSQTLVLRLLPKHLKTRIQIRYEGGNITKEMLQDAEVLNKQRKIVAGRFLVQLKAGESDLEPKLCQAVMEYLLVLSILIETGRLKRKEFPVHRKPVLEERLLHPIFYPDLLQELTVFSTTFHAETDPEFQAHPTHPCMRIRFPLEAAYTSATDSFRYTNKSLYCEVLPVLFPLAKFQKVHLTQDFNTSRLSRVSDLCEKEDFPNVELMQKLVNDLIGVVTELRNKGFALTQLKETWYISDALQSPVILPVWRFATLSHSPICDPALWTFAALKSLKSFDSDTIFVSAALLLPLLRNHPLLSSLSPNMKKSLLFRTESRDQKSVSLLKALQRIYWKVLMDTKLGKVQKLTWEISVLEEHTPAYTLFYAVKPKLRKPPPCSLKTLPIATRVTVLKQVGEVLLKTHKEALAHLSLSPRRIHYDELTGEMHLSGFKISLFHICRKYAKTDSTDPMELDFIDPGVLSYIYWKRQSLKTPEIMRKRQKYVALVDCRSDVYSFAMLIYHSLFPAVRPFFYCPETENFSGFFQNVVKEHRKPMVSEKFERNFPEFTDALRRSWERPEVRPTVSHLLSFLEQLGEFSQFIQTNIPSNI